MEENKTKNQNGLSSSKNRNELLLPICSLQAPNTYVEIIKKNPKLFPNGNNTYYCTFIFKYDYLLLKSHESLSMEHFITIFQILY